MIRGYKKLKPEEQKRIDAMSFKMPKLFGISPEKYILPLYGFIAFLLFFSLFLLPAILFPGSYIRVESKVQGSAVYIDDIRKGITPFEYFLPAGKHEIRLERTDIKSSSIEIELPSQIIASLFSFARQTIFLKQEFSNEDGFLSEGISEFSKWEIAPYFHKLEDGKVDTNLSGYVQNEKGALSNISDPIGYGHEYHRPPILENLSENYLNMGGKNQNLIDALIAAIPYINDDFSLKDWLEAAKIANFASENFLPIFQEADFPSSVTKVLTTLFPNISFSSHKTNIAVQNSSKNIASLLFHEFQIKDKTVYIANEETPVRLWQEFIETNPEWNSLARQKLINNNLADDNYLNNLELKNLKSEQGISDISYAAILEFLKWYTKKLSPELIQNGFVATLPLIAEWQAVDQIVKSKSKNGPWLTGSDIDIAKFSTDGFLPSWRGGLFEFSLDAQGQNSSVFNEKVQVNSLRFKGYFKGLLGGSKSLLESDFDANSPFGFPENYTSPVVGFRIWLVKR